MLLFPAIFYLNTYLLFPKLFFKKKYFLYFLSVGLLLAIVSYLRPYDSLLHNNHSVNANPVSPGLPPPGDQPQGPPPAQFPASATQPGVRQGPLVDIISVALFLVVIAVGTALVLLKRWSIAVKRAADAEAYRAKAELFSLKAQINPHFLFNTLNNIYSLALTKDDNTAACIMMLSNIMRYVTDEATQEMVPLQNEADCVRDFIELNKIRLGSKIRFNYSIGGNMEGKMIAPLLYITFVENVFKYGISNHEISEINIYLVTDENKITFFCQNKLLPAARAVESTGVGIANTKKRLEYLYPGRHNLRITDDDGYYTVTLVIYS